MGHSASEEITLPDSQSSDNEKALNLIGQCFFFVHFPPFLPPSDSSAGDVYVTAFFMLRRIKQTFSYQFTSSQDRRMFLTIDNLILIVGGY
ncbi:hypothetical protein DEH81_08985 [Pectobacterium zantedeschiae]|nr:hypothetical protein DEH81_08985 [Pectobacterium zantedeschiae]